MTTTYEGKSAVQSGYYLNATTWAIEPVATDGGHLPGGPGRWMRIPTAAALLLVPVLGATFLMALPLIGFAITLQAIAMSVFQLFHAHATELAVTMSPGWQPGEAHFTGKRSESAGVEEKGPTTQGDALDDVAAEIEKRRSEQK